MTPGVPIGPNWTQIVSAIAACASLLISAFVAIVVYNLKTQFDVKANQVQSYIKLLERMENIRPDRQSLRNFISKHKDKDGFSNTVEYWEKQEILESHTTEECQDKNGIITNVPIKNILSRVTREFDIIGFMDRSDLISKDMVNQFYAVPLVDFTPLFKAYISLLRNKDNFQRDGTHLWELEQFMESIKHVKSNHPANTGEKGWPKNPRIASLNGTKPKESDKHK